MPRLISGLRQPLPQRSHQTGTATFPHEIRHSLQFSGDDFRLEVGQPGGRWQVIPLPNGDFEAAASAALSATRLPPGWQTRAPTAGFTYRVALEANGNHYLLLRGTEVVPYGHNARAGHYQLANGVKLYYETYGQGQPILLLHGNGESIASFGGQIAELARHHRVIAVDTRDHGQSAATKSVFTYDLFTQDMLALLDALQLPAVHIVGWSDGGNTGLSLALHHPERVKSLVRMGANICADSSAVPAKFLDYVRQGSRRGPAHRRLNTLMLNHPQMKPADLAGIKVPTLVLAGEKDLSKEAHTRLIAASIPGAQLVIFPGLTHYAPQETPALFNQIVLDFLARTGQ